MTTTLLTATEARKNFFTMLKDIETPGFTITITHEGKPKGVFLSIEEFDGLMETLSILSDPEEVQAIQEGIDDARHGRVTDLDFLEQELFPKN
jgi:prevent-host-death family protein